MDPLLFFGVITLIYLLLYCFLHLCKGCVFYDTLSTCLRKLGITIDFLRLRFYTTVFNRSLNRGVLRSSNGNCNFLRSWLNRSFTLGVVVSFLLLPIGTILLFITIFGGDNNNNGKAGKNFIPEDESNKVKIDILLPGINLPLEEIGFYVTAFLVSSVVHELGHALAAILEDIPVLGFGFQLYYIIPFAYTEISSEHLNSLKWFKKLRILCAGIWHNFILAAFCYLLLSTVGFMAKPLFDINKGVIVTKMSLTSPLRAKERGLYEGNIITEINDCKVYDERTWYICLLKALRIKTGYCISSDFIRLNDESIEISHHGPDGTLRCCDDSNEKLCCFEYVDDFNNDAPVEIPQHVCLHVRNTLENALGYCNKGRCEQDGFCLRPLLRNTTTICTIKRTGTEYSSSSSSSTSRRNKNSRSNLKDVIYIGNPVRDIAQTVHVSGFIPKQHIILPKWADIYVLLLKYYIVFSFGLALVNAIPCFGFDGYHITNTIINSFLVNRVTERRKRDVIALIVAGIGSLLFALAVLKVLFLTISRRFF